MAPKTTQKQQKYFECDSVCNKFCGIFSANYCWPQEYESQFESKNWSQIMTKNNEWFEKTMFSQIVKKIPLITNENNNYWAVIHLNECLFGLILKELDLLTSYETQYFESILDLFNDKISFGLILYSKLCFQFNWRLVYVQLIGQHFHRNRFIESLFNEINNYYETNDKLLTNEEIYYFYSLIESLCLKVMVNNITNAKTNDQELVHIFGKCKQKLLQLSGDRFVRRLAVYNVVTQELIEFIFNLITSDYICDEEIDKQLSSIEEIISEILIKSETEDEIRLNDKHVLKDIAIARDHNESLELMNRESRKAIKSVIELPSLKAFYEFLNSKSPQQIQLSRYHYLADVLNDNSNPYYKRLIEILLSFGDFEKHNSLFTLINALDINRFELLPKLISKLMETREQNSKRFFASLLYKSLKSAPNIDIKSRLKEFGFRTLCDAKCDVIKTLFNQITNENNSQLIIDLNLELEIGIFMDPFSVYDMLMNLSLHHNRAQIPFVAQLITGKLYHLSTYRQNEEKETFLMKFIVHKFVEKPSLKLVDNIIKLITHIIGSQLDEGFECVLPLDQLFVYLIQDECLPKEEIVWLKLVLIKRLIELSGDKSWDSIQTNPVPTIVFLFQFLDYFWRTPPRKQLVVDIIKLIIKEKMTRNLTEEELSSVDSLLAKRAQKGVQKASTHRIYMTYIEERFPKPIAEVINIRNNIYHDQILHYASITKDFMWICDIYTQYEVFTKDIKIALQHISAALIAEEWLQLFRFLRMYYFNTQVVCLLRGAIVKQTEAILDNKKYMIKCLIDIVMNELLIPTRDEMIERPLTLEDTRYREFDLGILFKSMASFDNLYATNDLSVSLRQILVELATRMKKESLDAYSLYSEEHLMPDMAKDVLRNIYGFSYPTVQKSYNQELLPVGLQPFNQKKNKDILI